MDVKITERGWAGHFCCSKSCLFRRNTLLEYGDKKWIVSTVGNMIDPLTGKLITIGYERWYETMAFEATESDGYIGIFGTLCRYMIDNGRCDVFCPYAETKDKDGECEAWRTIRKIRQEG